MERAHNPSGRYQSHYWDDEGLTEGMQDGVDPVAFDNEMRELVEWLTRFLPRCCDQLTRREVRRTYERAVRLNDRRSINQISVAFRSAKERATFAERKATIRERFK